MGRVLMNEPPDCPEGQWCPACLMTAKQRQWEMHGDEALAKVVRDCEEKSRA